MHIIIGLAAAVALLYRWLLGGWFARVLMFLVFVAAFGGLGALLLLASPGAPAAAGWIGGILGALLAWPIASLPINIQRDMARRHLIARAAGRRW